MFYVKSQIDANSAIVTKITDENVFTRCPDCGCEISVELNDVIDDDGQLDLYGLGICCPECSRARWKAAHRSTDCDMCRQEAKK